MGDVISEVLPHLQDFFNDHCVIVFPGGGSEVRIYYSEYVGEIRRCDSGYRYSVRPIAETTYVGDGQTIDHREAINKIYSIMTALRRPATAA